MIVALIHWRIRPDDESIEAFLDHWKTNNTIGDRPGLMAEFLSDSLSMSDFPYITWHLDAESLGNFKSYVTVGLWQDAEAFGEQVAVGESDKRISRNPILTEFDSDSIAAQLLTFVSGGRKR